MSQPRQDRSRLVFAALVIAVASISFASIFFKKAAPTHPLVCAGLRLSVAALLLCPWTFRFLLSGKMTRGFFLSAAGAGVAYGLHFGTWVTSLTLTSVAASVTLVTTTPLILAVAGVITGRDRPGRRLWFCLAVALAGLVFIGGRDAGHGSAVLLGDLLAFVGALAMAAYMTLGRRMGQAMDVLPFSGIATAVGGAVLLSAAFFSGVPVKAASTESLVYIVLAALAPQLIGHNLITWSLRHAKPSTVAMAVVGEPVGATLLAWLWLGESLTGFVLLGCSLTLAAVFMSIADIKSRPISHPA